MKLNQQKLHQILEIELTVYLLLKENKIMLYLIKSMAYGDNGCPVEICKIGYCADESLSRRMEGYKTHNPTYKLISTISEVTEEQEKALHRFLKDRRFPGTSEWYYLDGMEDLFKGLSLKYLNELVIKDPYNISSSVIKLTRRDDIASKWIDSLYDDDKEIDQRLILNDPTKDYLNKSNLKYGKDLTDFFEIFINQRNLRIRLKMACEFMFSHSPEQGNLLVGLLNDIDVVKKYLTELGPEKCRSYSYQTGRLAEVIKREQSDQIDISLDVYANFDSLIGRRLEKTEIKGILQKVYVENNIKSIATATDLERWYELKSVKINRPDGTRINGYEILKRK